LQQNANQVVPLQTRIAQAIYQKILQKESGIYQGGSSDDEGDSSPSTSDSDDGDGAAGDRDEADEIEEAAKATPTSVGTQQPTAEQPPSEPGKRTKRKRSSAPVDDGKTKNSRFGESPNGRSTVATTMQGLAKSVSNLEQSSVVEALMAAQQQQTTMMMQMMQQQAQQQAQQQNNMMMMMLAMMGKQPSSSSSSNSAPSSAPFEYLNFNA